MIDFVRKFKEISMLNLKSKDDSFVGLFYIHSLTWSSIQTNLDCGYWDEEVAGTNSIV